MKIGRILYVASILFCLATLPQTLMSQQEAKQKSTVDLGAFVKEIMKLKFEGNRMELAMWCPFEFYVEASLAEGGQTRTAVERDIGFLKPYFTVIVQCSIDQPDGSSLYSSEKEVRTRAVLKLADGTEIHPLDKVPPAVSATVAAMKVIMASEGDPGGANMHVLVFPTKNKQGQSIVDTAQKDKLTLVLKANRKFNETIFTWHTPFDATTSVPPCPDCGESVSAKWSFCPWCGKKLSKVTFAGYIENKTTLSTRDIDKPSQAQQVDKPKTIATGNKVIITNSIGMKLVYIPPGEFMMGSPSSEEHRDSDEGPQLRVRISKGFYMGVYEVTQAQYKAIGHANRSRFKGDNLPVENVPWSHTVEFCRRLSQKEAKTYRLPTEAEWEYACRAGTTTTFNTGETISTDQANYDGNYVYGNGSKGVCRKKTTEVGSFRPNAFGLYDMHGNVWEWCQDWYDERYYTKIPLKNPAVDPVGQPTRKERVLRGGSWDSNPWFCRSAYRPGNSPMSSFVRCGFRVVMEIEQVISDRRTKVDK